MHVGHASSAREQRAHIAACLRAMQLAKGPAHFRDLDVARDVGRDDEEETAVGSPFVELTGRVQVARTDAERRRTAERAALGGAHLLEFAKDVGCGRDVREDREVVTGSGALTQLRRCQRG